MQIADFLSRYRPREGKHIEMDHTINAVRWSKDKMKTLKDATISDEVLSDLIKLLCKTDGLIRAQIHQNTSKVSGQCVITSASKMGS